MSASQALEEISAKVNALFSRDAATQVLRDELAGFKATAADLKAKLSACETERDSLKASLTEKDAEVATAKASADKASSELTAANDAADKAKSDLKALEENPSKQAVSIAAKAGVKASDLPKGDLKAERICTNAEFAAMTFPDRNAFIRSGGKVRG